MKALQKFNPKAIEQSKKLSIEEIFEFLESFRLLSASGGKQGKSKLISMKVPEALLLTFKAKAQSEGKPYQSAIKELMWNWINES